MQASIRTDHPDEADAIELFELVVTGPLRRVEANSDGSWTVTPVTGRPLMLTGPAEVAAYVDQAHGTGPAALAPAVSPTVPDSAGCGCVPTTRTPPSLYYADMMQARAICAGLADFGIAPSRRLAAYDEDQQAATVRVATDHGIYALIIPAVHRQYAVLRNGKRDGVIESRRVPAVTDALVTIQFAYYLRDRGAL